jgi:hypothetical protein
MVGQGLHDYHLHYRFQLSWWQVEKEGRNELMMPRGLGALGGLEGQREREFGQHQGRSRIEDGALMQVEREVS